MARGRYLFVSDLHLDASAPEAIAVFLRFLQEEAATCDALYILGDLFESWIGDDDDEPARDEICRALRRLVDGGVPCFVQRGNRDFLLGDGFGRRTGCTLLPDPLLLVVGERRIAISHGDLLCTGDTAYQDFRALVRSPGFQPAFLSLPLATRRALAGHARHRSRRHTRGQPPAIMDVAPATVAQLLRTARADLLIHGHTHRPGVHRLQVDGLPCVRAVLGDWYDTGSCLELDAAGDFQIRGLGITR